MLAWAVWGVSHEALPILNFRRRIPAGAGGWPAGGAVAGGQCRQEREAQTRPEGDDRGEEWIAELLAEGGIEPRLSGDRGTGEEREKCLVIHTLTIVAVAPRLLYIG